MPNPNLRRLAQGILLTGILGAASFTFLSQSPASAAQTDHLQAILSQMNAASARFHSAEADIKKEQFEKIVNDTTEQTGKIYYLRNGNTTQIGAEFNPPEAQTLEYKDGTVRLYNAGTNHIQQFQNLSSYEAYLALGFGGSGTDLQKSWNITDQGSEQMNDGSKSVSVEKLDLVSKSPGVKNNFTHITLWIDPSRDVSLKQEFFTPAGDTQTAIYSNIRLNQPIDLKAFAIKCKGKCS
jgi:outer membrane lipoprotein-sorting protein